jgi:molecular chaperone HtpG
VVTDLCHRHSDFIRYPIRLADEKGERKTLNSMKAVWLKRRGEVKDEELREFYKQLSHDWDDPLRSVTMHAEGSLEYHAALFLPKRAPFDLLHPHPTTGLTLYVRNVKIMDHCPDLLPPYLRFVRGVVDSPDLPLNVSREILQSDRQVRVVRNGLTKKVLDTIADLRDGDRPAYEAFWSESGRVLKEGVIAGGTEPDRGVRDRLVGMLLFSSSHDPAKLTTFAEYVGRMGEGQDAIYYLTGDSRAVLERSPHIEALRTRGVEVLYLTDPIDELLVQLLPEAAGKPLRSALKGSVEVGSTAEREHAKDERREQEQGLASLIEVLGKELDQQIRAVRPSSRLTSSPACLVVEEGDLSPRLERLLERVPGQQPGSTRRILEINPTHPLVTGLRDRVARDAADPLVKDYARLLLGQALLAEGSPLPDPAEFAGLIGALMTRGLGEPQTRST